MPTYVMLANWTDQGVRAIGDSPRRVDTAKKTLEEMGGQFRSVYMTMGRYDLIMIYDAPDDAVAARFTLMLGKLGNVRTTSLKAFPEEAYRQIINTLPEGGFHMITGARTPLTVDLSGLRVAITAGANGIG